MKNHIVERLQQIAPQIIEDEGGILLSYLFGSYGKGSGRIGSDIDLAYLVDFEGYRRDPFEAVAPAYRASARIGLMLDRDTDVIILNSASTELSYEIITSGIPIYECDHGFRLGYEAKIKGLYFDFQPFLETLRKKAIERLIT